MIAKTKPGTKQKQLRAAFYIRMSSSKQEESPTIQRQKLKKLCDQYGATCVKEFFDEGISGASRKRGAFQQMLAEANAGKFDILLVTDMDRFSRADVLTTNHFWFQLREAGIRIATCSKGELNFDDLGSWLSASVDAFGNSEYLKKLATRVCDGKANKAKLGMYLGKIPYGYDRVFRDETGKVVYRATAGDGFKKPEHWTVALEPSTSGSAEVVRELFERYSKAAVSVRSLARDFNERGIKTMQGKLWLANGLIQILKNRAYLGEYRIGPGKGKFANMEAEVFIADAHPALVTKELFDRVQAKLAARGYKQTKDRRSWTLIAGIGFCGHCGSRLKSHGYDSVHAYQCGGSANGIPCESGHVNAAALHELLIEAYKEAWLTDEALSVLRDRLLDRVAQRHSPKSDGKRLEQQIAALESKIAQGAERLVMVSAADFPAVSNLLASWRADRDRLKEELASLESSEPGYKVAPEKMVELAIDELRCLEKRLHDDDTAIAREAFREAFESVTVWWSKRQGTRRKIYEVSRAVVVLRHQPFSSLLRKSTQRMQAQYQLAAKMSGTPTISRGSNRPPIMQAADVSSDAQKYPIAARRLETPHNPKRTHSGHSTSRPSVLTASSVSVSGER